MGYYLTHDLTVVVSGLGGGCLCSSESSGIAIIGTFRKTATTRTTKTTTVRSCVKLYPTYFWGDPLIKGRDYMKQNMYKTHLEIVYSHLVGGET